MSRYLPDPDDDALEALVGRVRSAVRTGHVIVTDYAIDLAEDIEFDAFDIAATLADLTVADFERCEETYGGPAGSLEVLWVFTPTTDDDVGLWTELVERSGVVVVSFHAA